jgi:RNA polymerase sigma factor (sigma-70 family)
MFTTSSRFASTLRYVRALAGEPGQLGDGPLLARFVRHRDEAAFAELVRRHGPLVLGAARRRLADRHAAEDVFQATFLALARQAARLTRRGPLAGWLYTVASRLARKEQARAARRADLAALPPPGGAAADPLAEVSGRELLRVVDDELARLPERYRLPVLLCGLEGLTRDEAAARLGWSLGAFRGRLERGRGLLRERLTKRGLTVPVVLAAALAADTAAAVPPELLRSVTRAALAVPVGGGPLTALTAAAVVAVLGVGLGAGALPGGRPEAPTDPPPPAASPPPAARVDLLGDPLPDGALARLGSQRLRPGEQTYAVAFSPDGRRLASWSVAIARSSRLCIWDVTGGAELRRVDLPGVELTGLRWLADGSGVAVVRLGMDDFFVWNFADEKAPLPPAHPGTRLNAMRAGEILAVAVSPDGRWLATGRRARANEPQPIEVWELTLNRPLEKLKSRVLGEQPGHGYKFVFGPDSHTLFALSRTQEPNRPGAPRADGFPAPLEMGKLADQARLVVREVATGREQAAFDLSAALGGYGPALGLTNVAVTPDGQTLIVGQQGGMVRLWDWQAGKERRSFAAHPPGDPKRNGRGGIVALAISDDGRSLVTAGVSNDLRRWDLTTGQAQWSLNERQGLTQALAVSPDQKLVAWATPGGQVRIGDLASGADRCPVSGHGMWIGQVHVLPDGRTALTASSDGTIRSWDIATGRELRRVELEAPLRGWGWPAVFTPNGRGLLGRSTWRGQEDHEKLLWETATGRLQPLAEVFKPVKSWILTPPVQDAVLVLDRSDQTIALRDWPLGRLRQTFKPPPLEPPGTGYQTNAAALAADGRLAAAVGEDRHGAWRGHGWVSLFSTETGEVLQRRSTPDAYYQHVAITADGSGVIVGGSPMVPPMPVGQPRQQMKPQQALVLIDAESGEPVRSFVPPKGGDPTGFRSVSALAVSPDGRQVAAAERDHAIWVYELATGQARRHLAGHGNEVTALAFTPDGRRLVSVSHDLTGLVWDVSLAAAGRAGAVPADFDRLWADLAKPEWDLAGPGPGHTRRPPRRGQCAAA